MRRGGGAGPAKRGPAAPGPIEGPRGKPVTTLILAIALARATSSNRPHTEKEEEEEEEEEDKQARGEGGRHYRVSDSRQTRRSLVTMQAALMAIGLVLALFCPPTCALISRSHFSRPSTLRATLDCKQTPRSMVTSLATAQLNQPEPPAVKPPIDIGQLAMLALMVVFLIIQLSQGATQVSQGAAQVSQGAMQVSQGATLDAIVKMQVSQSAMLTSLSTKFDQVTFFVVGVIALATFGGSVVSILKYFDDIKEKKERRGRD